LKQSARSIALRRNHQSPDSAAGNHYGGNWGKLDRPDSQSLASQFAWLHNQLSPIASGMHWSEGGALCSSCSSHLNRIKRVSRQNEERLIVLSAEEDVDGALRNFEDAYLPAGL
jgi:hypothetical protein